MKDKPILFKKPMYDAILAGRKTQTRRIVKPQPTECGLEFATDGNGWGFSAWQDPGLLLDEHSEDGGPCQRQAPYQIGDRIWVKEPFRIINKGRDFNSLFVEYKYKNPETKFAFQTHRHLTIQEMNKWEKWKEPYKGKSPLFMFKSLARLWLEVTDVRVERLQDISCNDIQKEGLFASGQQDATDMADELYDRWITLWDSINKDRADWKSNPHVWVIEFKKIGE